jgi:hypothetical protein
MLTDLSNASSDLPDESLAAQIIIFAEDIHAAETRPGQNAIVFLTY